MSKSAASSKAKSNAKKNSKAKKKAAPAEGGVKRKMRFKPGTVALREIKRYQKTIDHLIPRAPFQRLVKSVVQGVDHEVRFAA